MLRSLGRPMSPLVGVITRRMQRRRLPKLGRLVQSEDYRALDRAAAAWIDSSFGLLEAAAPWLVRADVPLADADPTTGRRGVRSERQHVRHRGAARPDQTRLQVRVAVPLGVFESGHVLRHQPVQPHEEVARHVRVGVLLDRDRGGGVRAKNDARSLGHAAGGNRLLHQGGDVEELGPGVGADGVAGHGGPGVGPPRIITRPGGRAKAPCPRGEHVL